MSSGGAKIYVGNLSWNTNDELLGQVSSLRASSIETVELTLFSLCRPSPSSVRSPTFVSSLGASTRSPVPRVSLCFSLFSSSRSRPVNLRTNGSQLPIFNRFMKTSSSFGLRLRLRLRLVALWSRFWICFASRCFAFRSRQSVSLFASSRLWFWFVVSFARASEPVMLSPHRLHLVNRDWPYSALS
jgi:hypothetical protein